MAITHVWNGTTLTITTDSGTSSCDLKGEKGDMGVRGPQGIPGGEVGGLSAQVTELAEKVEEKQDVFATVNGSTLTPIDTTFKVNANNTAGITLDGEKGSVTLDALLATTLGSMSNTLVLSEGKAKFSYLGFDPLVVTGIATPTENSGDYDAVNKAYVDNLIAELTARIEALEG